MKNTKKLKPFVLILASLLLLCACQKANAYTDRLSANELARATLERMDEDDFMVADADYLNEYFPMPDGVLEHTVCMASDGNDLDEFGIFHLREGNSVQMKSLLESYLKDSLERNSDFYNSYIPEELPKLRDAEVHIYGNYAAYAIMEKEDRIEFFRILEGLLSEPK